MTKEKKVIFEEMSMVEDTPDDLVVERFTRAFWPDHPLGRPILGTKQSVGGFKRQDLATFFRKVYRPANILVVAAGHLDHPTAVAMVAQHFGGLETGGATRDGGPPRPSPPSSRAPRRSWSRCTSAWVRAAIRRCTRTATSPTS